MSTIVLPPPELTRDEYELAASLTTNKYLVWVCSGLACCAVLLGFQNYSLSRAVAVQKPLVIRVNEVGRAEAITYPFSRYEPQEAEVRYFINDFFAGFYGRNKRTILDLYPRSLYYLGGQLFTQVEADDRRTKWLSRFVTSAESNVNIHVRNVILDPSHKPTYRAQVDWEKVISQDGGNEKRELYTSVLYFVIATEDAAKHNELVKYNPLGIAIQQLGQPEQAFDR